MQRLRGRRTIVVVGLLLTMLGTGSQAVRASDDDRLVVHYVAGEAHVIGPDIVATAVRTSTGVATAPLGRFSFTATDTDAVLTIHDAGPLLLPISVSHRGLHCVANHGSILIDGLTPGETISVYVGMSSYGLCGVGRRDGGTVGIVAIDR